MTLGCYITLGTRAAIHQKWNHVFFEAEIGCACHW